MRSQIAEGSIHMTDTARSARLVLARATRIPNRSISGSFWYCGAPPDREIAVAIANTETTLATNVAAKAATHSVGPGAPLNRPIAWKIVRSTIAMTAKFDRLNASLTADGRAVSSIAMAEPAMTDARYSTGVKKNNPATAGISLSEKECDSRRKWTTMTFDPVARNRSAGSDHGKRTGPVRDG